MLRNRAQKPTTSQRFLHLIWFFTITMVVQSCAPAAIEEIHIGYIGPLSTRATDLGIGPANAMKLAVSQYNEARQEDAPKVYLHIEDDEWEGERALAAYERLKAKYPISILFISNTDGTAALQEQILQDDVLIINPLNNDSLLSSLNRNTFKIAKSTEEANGLLAMRIIELGLKKTAILHYPNNFMTTAAQSVKGLLDQAGFATHLVAIDREQVDFSSELEGFKAKECDAYAFLGYKELGFGMKQARDMGITAPFFGSTVLLDPAYYANSEGTIIGTECCFFTPPDGNYVLANEFLVAYTEMFGEEPSSIWPPMQAYDAMNLTLNELRQLNSRKQRKLPFCDWMRGRLHKVQYYQGVCGNISIGEDGASRGIYFSLYEYVSKGTLEKVKR